MSTDPRRLDRYELQERLGRGGMAEVWRALDTQLQRHVAIKILHADLQNDPSFISRFEREAQLIASLHHPNIVQIYDFRATHASQGDETIAYMVMDYVEGTTLAHYLHNTSRAGRFPAQADIVRLFVPICQAVDYAHERGMIHRDLKPANILLDRRDASNRRIGEPILSDFGIAKLLANSVTVQSGWWLGTPYYTSPEQARGAPGDERSDIYALGVILYEMCVGTLPFQGDSPTAIIMQQISADPISPALVNPNIPPPLSAIILRALAKTPGDRFASASSMAIALSDALHVPVSASLRQAAYQMEAGNNATFISPIRSGPPRMTPLPPTTPQAGGPVLPGSPPVGVTPIPLSLDSVNMGQDMDDTPRRSPHQPIEPGNGPSGAHPYNSSPGSTVFMSNTSSSGSPPWSRGGTPVPPGSSPSPPRQRTRVIIAILVALLLVVASMSTLLLLAHNSAPATAVDEPGGEVFFISSGQLDPNNSKGINDQVQLDLHNIPDPPAGKAYYGWLLSDRILSEMTVTALGQLHVEHGNVHLFYAGNALHNNLLATRSRVLITREDASNPPSSNSPSYKDWVYYAQLSQAVSSKDKLHFSMLDHLRHLLSDSPELQQKGLRGGLDMWFLRNTQKILEWSSAARDDWQNSPDLLHRQLIRILDYVDGQDNVKKDLPASDPVMLADPHMAQVPLLGPQPDGKDPPGYVFDDEAIPGYIFLIDSHLSGTVLSPDATSDQRDLAARVHMAINQTRSWLEQVHQDAKQLVTMNKDQLAQPQALSLLNDMFVNAQYAYTGKTDPQTGQLQGGATWICSNIQRIANFELKPFNLKGYKP